MKYLVKISSLVLCLILCASCLRKELRSMDFTAEHVFTEGIEGPAVSPAGEFFAVNFEREGTIGRVDALGKGEVFLTLPDSSIGNGIRFDKNGNMFVADYKGHRVYRIKKGSKTPEVWAFQPDMNQPNDLDIAADGSIYLSDPNWNEGSGKLWRVHPDKRVELLETGMGTTNGITISPGDSILYVAESLQRTIWRYDLEKDGAPTNKKQFMSFEDFGLDGMRCDVRGNLYITRFEKGTVLILTPDGRIMDEVILSGKKPTNITFGGPDGRTCFVTVADRGCVEIFRSPFPGKFFANTNKN